MIESKSQIQRDLNDMNTITPVVTIGATLILGPLGGLFARGIMACVKHDMNNAYNNAR